MRYALTIFTTVIVAAPLFVVNGPHRVWLLTWAQTAQYQTGWDWRIAWLNLHVWWWNPIWHRDYSAGPFLDPVTGALALVGLALAVWEIRR